MGINTPWMYRRKLGGGGGADNMFRSFFKFPGAKNLLFNFKGLAFLHLVFGKQPDSQVMLPSTTKPSYLVLTMLLMGWTLQTSIYYTISD